MDSEKKLNDLLKAVLDQASRCKQLDSDIDQLIKLAKGLDGYTSDDEEAFFVESLVSELEGLKPKVTLAQEHCKQLESEIVTLKKFIDDKKQAKHDLTDDEITDLIAKIAQIEDRVE